MIGSQATKGMHILTKFAPIRSQCGVWIDHHRVLTAIEAYPSACKGSKIIEELSSRYSNADHQDKRDALTCALLAYLFVESPEVFAGPSESVDSVPISEGWIWVPKDTLGGADRQEK